MTKMKASGMLLFAECIVLAGLAILLALRGSRQARLIHRWQDDRYATIFSSFQAIDIDGKSVIISPNKDCPVSVFFVVHSDKLTSDLKWWNDALAFSGSAAGRCSYAMCSSGDCRNASPRPSFHLLESAAYEPSLVYARLLKSGTFLIQDGRWQHWIAPEIPKTAAEAGALIKRSGL